MKRIFISIIIVFLTNGIIIAAPVDDVKAELQKLMDNMLSPISIEMAKHMGYYTGSGNVTPVNTSGYVHPKFGIGLGFNMTEVLSRALKKEKVFESDKTNIMDFYFDTVSKGIALLPFPYDEAYFKIGLPLMPADVGLRIGFVPSMSLDVGSGTIISFGELHIGAEGRYMLYEFFRLIKVDARVSLDFDTGGIGASYSHSDVAYTNNLVIGTNDYKITLNYQWGGISLGTKIMAGIDIPFIGGPYMGLGININLGGVKTSSTMDDTIKYSIGGSSSIPTLTGEQEKAYNFLDLRLIIGLQLFFANAAFEYGLLNKDLSWTIIPISLAF